MTVTEEVTVTTEVEKDDKNNPFYEPHAQAEKNKKRFRSCTVVEKYKKAMGVMVVVLLTILNIVMIVVGIIQFCSSPCPIEPVIPIYLIGAGILGICTRIMMIIKHFKKIESIVLNRIIYGLLIADIIFFIAGSCWIFIHFKDKQYSCNGAAFTWAFLILIFHYIILISPILVPCCIECYHCCFLNKMRIAA